MDGKHNYTLFVENGLSAVVDLVNVTYANHNVIIFWVDFSSDENMLASSFNVYALYEINEIKLTIKNITYADGIDSSYYDKAFDVFVENYSEIQRQYILALGDLGYYDNRPILQILRNLYGAK